MSSNALRQHLSEPTTQPADRALDFSLDDGLNQAHGAGSPTYGQLRRDCQTGSAEGWLCERAGGGIRYGRVFKPAADLHGFSVDVVDMSNIAGPHHAHPNRMARST